MKHIYIFFFFFFSFSLLNAQVANLPNIIICEDENNELLIPINFEEINNIGAISLSVIYDPSVLEFIEISDLNENFTNSPFVNVIDIDENQKRVAIGWFNMSAQAVSIGTDKFLDLRFNYLSGNTNLIFTQTEIASNTGIVLSVNYINGSIQQNITPTILTQAINDTICENETGIFEIETINENDIFQWQGLTENNEWINLNTADFENVTSANLSVTSSFSLIYSKFRCKVGELCPTYSNEVSLIVGEITNTILDEFPILTLSNLPFTLSGGFPEQGEYSGDFVNNGLFNVDEIGDYTINYVYENQYHCSSMSSQVIHIIDAFRIFGNVHYADEIASNLTNVEINLIDNITNEIIDNTTTNENGDYQFLTENSGEFRLNINYPLVWNYSGNSTDALLTAQSYTEPDIFSILQKKVADVNNDDTVNATDALFIQKRYINDIDDFPSTDWLQEEIIINVNNIDLEQNISSAFMGDVNFSYFENTTQNKQIQNIDLVYEGTVTANVEDEFIVELKIKDALEVGAISIILNYDNELIEVLEINSTLNNFLHNIEEDKINFSWYSIAPHNFLINEAILTLRLKAISSNNNNDILFNLSENCEFANAEAEIINDLQLSLPSLSIFSGIENLTKNNELSFKCLPNPFAENLRFTYEIKEKSNISLKIVDISGKKVFEKTLNNQDKGNYNLDIETKNLNKGIYFSTIEIKNKNIFLQKSIKILKF